MSKYTRGEVQGGSAKIKSRAAFLPLWETLKLMAAADGRAKFGMIMEIKLRIKADLMIILISQKTLGINEHITQ